MFKWRYQAKPFFFPIVRVCVHRYGDIIIIFGNIRYFVFYLYRANAIPVYNLTQHNLNPITWDAVMTKGREETMKNPFELMLWYPTGSLTANRFVHTYKVICYHWIPAYLIDGILFLLGQKRL